jgi:hypothetical protein
LKRFLRWLHAYRPPLDHAPVERVAPVKDDQIARQVIERLAEDESLRGDLMDDAFKPIIDWVTSLVPAAASRAAPDPDPDEAGEQLNDAARQTVRSLVRVVSDGDTSSLRDQLQPPLLTADEAERARQAVPDGPLPGSSAAERAQALIAALKSALPEKSA